MPVHRFHLYPNEGGVSPNSQQQLQLQLGELLLNHGSASPGEEVPSGGEALAAPTNIHPMSLCISKIFATIAWDKVGGATGYEINIYEGAEHSGESQIVQASTGNTFSLHRLEAGTTYYLAIRAVKDGAGQTVCCEWVDYSYRHMGHF